MPQIVPIKELRNTTEISERCHASNEPIFVTKNGYGDLVVMSIEAYENMLHHTKVDLGIQIAEDDIRAGGELHDARSTLANYK